MFFDFLQLAGGLILSVGYVPQIIQIIETKSVKDLSIKTFLSIFIGILLMEIYAAHLVFWQSAGHAFLITNTASLILSSIVVFLIVKYKNKKGGKRRPIGFNI